jgi:serine/threonine protein phosphatase PrpC
MITSKEGEEELKTIRKKHDAASYNDGSISLGTGCTACVVLITPTKIFTANAGDSRGVLSRKGHALPLSSDHKPENEAERKRIQAAGGDIVNGRVNGGLNLSRSFGDFNYKKAKNKAWDEQLIICKPDIT